MKKMDIKTLYKDDKVILQRLIIFVGDCSMVKYREIRNYSEEVVGEGSAMSVMEVKQPPIWYLRWLKLNEIGI